MLRTLIFMSALGAATSAQAGLDEVRWGQTREQLSALVPGLELVTDQKTDSDGLIYGARSALQMPGFKLDMRFLFTPMTQKLAGYTMVPQPPTACTPLLAETRQLYGKGVNVSLSPDVDNWQFSDIKNNTEWHFYVFKKFGRATQETCGIRAEPLLGTSNAP